MKFLMNLFLIVLVMISFSQCSSAQKLQKEAPINIGKAYFQNWVAGIQGGGSGLNLFVPTEGISNKNIHLDSVYFREKTSKLEFKQDNPTLFIGRFSSELNQKKDIIMSDKPYGEYGNEMSKINSKFPFKLKDSECVISYKEGDKIKYFKIENVIEKQALHYPSAPPKKQ